MSIREMRSKLLRYVIDKDKLAKFFENDSVPYEDELFLIKVDEHIGEHINKTYDIYFKPINIAVAAFPRCSDDMKWVDIVWWKLNGVAHGLFYGMGIATNEYTVKLQEE